MATKKTGVIFITKNRIDIYLPGISDILHYVFPETMVQDMEIVNKEELINQIVLFFQQNKIIQVNFICLIYDELLFGKEIKNSTVEQQIEDKKKFISSVPFEYTIVKEIPSKDSVLVIATNREFVESIILGIQRSENTVSYTSASYMVIGTTDVSNGFTKELGELVLKKSDLVKQASLITEEKTVTQAVNDEKAPFYKSSKNRRVVILSGVFIILIGILIVVFLVSNTSNKPAATEQPVQTPIQAQASPTKAQSIISNPEDTRIRIRTNNLERFSAIQSALQELNFEIIELDTSNTVLSPTTTIIFDPSLAPTLQQNITQIIQSSDNTATTQVNPVGSYHVVITLGQ